MVGISVGMLMSWTSRIMSGEEVIACRRFYSISIRDPKDAGKSGSSVEEPVYSMITATGTA